MGATAGGGYEKSNNKTQFNYLGENNGFSPGEELMKYLTMNVLQGKALGDNMLGGKSYANKYKGGTFGADIEGAMRAAMTPPETTTAPPETTTPTTPPPPPPPPPVDSGSGGTHSSPAPVGPNAVGTVTGGGSGSGQSAVAGGSGTKATATSSAAAGKAANTSTSPWASSGPLGVGGVAAEQTPEEIEAEKNALKAQAAQWGNQFNEQRFYAEKQGGALTRKLVAAGMNPSSNLDIDGIANSLGAGVPMADIEKHYMTLLSSVGPDFASKAHGSLARVEPENFKNGTQTTGTLANAQGGGFAPTGGAPPPPGTTATKTNVTSTAPATTQAAANVPTTTTPGTKPNTAAPLSLANYVDAAAGNPAGKTTAPGAAQTKPQVNPGPAQPAGTPEETPAAVATGGYRPPSFEGQGMPTTGQAPGTMPAGIIKGGPAPGGGTGLPTTSQGLGKIENGLGKIGQTPVSTGNGGPATPFTFDSLAAQVKPQDTVSKPLTMGVGMPAPDMGGGMTMQIPPPQSGVKAGASAVAPGMGGGSVALAPPASGAGSSVSTAAPPQDPPVLKDTGDGGGPPEDDPNWTPTVPPPPPNNDPFKFDYGAGVGTDFNAPTGGIYGRYEEMMNAKQGFDPATRSALTTGAASATQKQAEATRGAMRRRVAATGNDTGFFGGMAQTGRDQSANLTGALQNATLADYAEKTRKNDAGTKGMTDLYNQQQAYTMDLMKMLGNLGGRQREVYNNGATTSANFSVVV